MFFKIFILFLAVLIKVKSDGDAPFVDRALNHQSVCVQREHPGPCDGSLQRWYFDQNSKICKEFVFGGCQGNDNNFETEAECMRVCSEKKACPTSAGLPPAQGCRHKQSMDNKGCPMKKLVCDAKPKRK